MNIIKFISSRQNWSIPYAIFAAIFVVLPLLLIVVFAFTDENGALTLYNFQKFLAHPEAINTFVYSIGIAFLNTLLCILLGYPAAYILTQTKMKYANTIVMLFILPMWVNILVRTLATVALFDFADLQLGEGALLFGMVYNFIPFMIYPIYNTLQKMDRKLYRSSRRPGSIALAAVFQGHPAPLHAGRSKWHSDGIHANHLYLRYLRTADDEQHQALRYHHPGEHQQFDVELRCSPLAHHALPHRRLHPHRR